MKIYSIIIKAFIGAVFIILLPQFSFAQFPGTPPIHSSGGVGGFGMNIPTECEQLLPIRQQISPNGLLGVVQNVGDITMGMVEGFTGDLVGLAGEIGLGVMTGGMGNLVGGALGGLLGGGDDATKKAVEELTKVQMTALAEAECHSILQDIYLTVLKEQQLEKMEEEEYNQQDVRENIRKIEAARENLGYLREYLADEYYLLYDIWERHEAYEENPQLRIEIQDQFSDYSIQEADRLIINARENQRMTGNTHDYLDVLTGILGNEELTPTQAMQLQGYITALHAQEATEAKHILAGQASFIAQLEIERRQEEKDAKFFEERYDEEMQIQMDSFLDAMEGAERRGLIPSWAGRN